MHGPHNLPDALARGAREAPERGLTVYDRRGRTVGRRTYADLLASARQTAGSMAAHRVLPGDRVVIALPSSFEWFDAWLGCILLGALPVATTPGAAFGEAGEGHIRLSFACSMDDIERGVTRIREFLATRS